MSTKRDVLGLKASDVRTGQSVTVEGERWQVMSPAPETGKFWLHRHIEGRYETKCAHVSEMEGYRA